MGKEFLLVRESIPPALLSQEGSSRLWPSSKIGPTLIDWWVTKRRIAIRMDAMLVELGIEMMAPHRRNRRPENRTQDGRKLKVHKHRWIVERTISWLTSHRRWVVRHEKLLGIFYGLAKLGCFMIALKKGSLGLS